VFRGVLLGLLLLAVPGLLGASLLRSHPVAPSWPESPAPGVFERETPPRWDEPARESLAMLRRVTRTSSRSARTELAACERRAAQVAAAGRVRAFRHCATGPLGRVNAFGTANSRMLSNLAGTAGPTEACRRLVLSLSGLNGALGQSASNTLRTWVATWKESLAASRTIREIAREVSAFARGKGWGSTCRARPPAPAEPPPTA